MSTKKSRIVLLAIMFGFLPSIIMARTMKVFGTLKDTEGQPMSGVTVSDGYTAVQTDKNGFYSFVRNEAAYYVHYSIPAECEVPIRYGIPSFFKKLDRDSIYDFILKRRVKGAENKFNIFFVADPQCQNVNHIRRFHNETVPDIKQMVANMPDPSYCITLGDIGYSEGEFNTNYILPMMKEEMERQNIGLPVFQTNGNHDHIYEGLSLNEQNPTPKERYMRMFEDIFGPVNYSWNRGQAHIVSMNSVMYTQLNKGSNYDGEFSKAELEWLKQDLKYVPKDKLLIFCTHIPVYTLNNKDSVLQILRQFPQCYIFTGHMHTTTYYRHPDGIKEFNLAAASGAWWWSCNNADGTPNGYKIVKIDGNKIIDQIWKSTGFDTGHQLRLYQGDCIFGGKYEKFQLPFGKDVVMANVFDWDEDWKVQVYEDGKLMGDMQHMPVSERKDLIPSMTSSKDWWAIGYNVGVIGRGHIGNSHRNSYCSSCSHMFIYKKKSHKSQIKVVATNPFGHQYECSMVLKGNAMDPNNHMYDEATPPHYSPMPGW